MKAPGNITVYLKDYKKPSFRIETVNLRFELHDGPCRVTSRLKIRRDPDTEMNAHLELSGEELKLESVSLDGVRLKPDQFEVSEELLRILHPPAQFTLEVVTLIEPEKNTELQGLYRSRQMFCTQNEPEGFRRITYFLDRPDMMATYTTRIEADQSHYPVLLANGNPTVRGSLGQGRHFVQWHDPFPKPCYLFALVAGDLGKIEDQFTTRSGRVIPLEIYVDKGNEPRCWHAMESLKRAMRWDEVRFGLEYDLDIFMIVAVEDFNSGAMENKGLNIFNARFILADPQVATDTDYELIESVIAHEYFHNWTGNRVTCRDWFQLSLKEGLTVFRDQEFSADMGAASVRRIAEVARLRSLQFAEDAGPMAHPIRPASYMEINNFYTTTVYEKGAEVIRMIQTLVGRDGFRKGIDQYFALYDGQAVTTEDFIHAMELANQIDLTQFKRWYNQAGTPKVDVQSHYEAAQKRFSLTLTQSCRATRETANKLPFHLPIRVGLLDSRGQDLIGSPVLDLKQSRQTFQFENIAERPIPSVLRGFSAPVHLHLDMSDEDLIFLLAHDSDPFTRWEASQQIISRHMGRLIDAAQTQQTLTLPNTVIEAFRQVLTNVDLEPAFRAQVLALPAESVYVQSVNPVDPEAIHMAHNFLLKTLADQLAPQLQMIYERTIKAATGYNVEIAGERALRNRCLHLLCATQQTRHFDLALQQLRSTQNMTDELSALATLASFECPQQTVALSEFYNKWKNESLVVNKWLQVQSAAPLATTLSRLQQLVEHPAYDIKNPNKVQSLLVLFGRDNLFGFHSRPSHSYKFLADQVLKIDELNPQISSRIVGAFNYWRKFDSQRQNLMRAELERLRAAPKLSKNVYEIVVKALDEPQS
jgi:aminopeptidase N